MADEVEVEAEELVGDGTAAEEAAREEEEQQAAAAAGTDVDDPTIETLGDTADDDALIEDGDPGGAGLGSSLGAGDDETTGVLTADEIADSLSDAEQQLAELVGSVGTSDPSLGEMGQYGPSGQGQPSVADGATPIDWSQGPATVSPVSGGSTTDVYNNAAGDTAMTFTTNHETGTTTQTWYDDDSNPVQTNETSGSNNDSGGTTTTNTSTTAAGTTTTTTTTDGDGNTTATSTTGISADGASGGGIWTTTDGDGNTTTEHAAMIGNTSYGTSTTTDEDGETTSTSTSVTTTDDDGNKTTETTTTDEDGTETTTTTSDPGPFGDEPVPGGLADFHQAELEGYAGQDFGSGDVDPNEYDDGEAVGDGQAPEGDAGGGVTDPPDGEELGQEGDVDIDGPEEWGSDVTDPADDDDFGGGVGPEDDSMQLPTQDPTIDESKVTGGDVAPRGTVEVEENLVPIFNSGVAGRQAAADDDFGVGSPIDAAASRDAITSPTDAGGTQAEVAYVAEVAEVHYDLAAPQEPDASRVIDTDLDEATTDLLADAIADQAPPTRGVDESDDLDPLD
jgi:hypothetical protein